MFSLEGKVCLITGASGGIGGAIASLFYQQGAQIVLSGRREESMRALAADWDKDRYTVRSTDLSDWTSLSPWIAEIEESFAPIDVIVNNAGATRDKLVMMMKDDDWKNVLDTNLSANFSLVRGVIRGMIKRRSGRVICISSIVGVSGNPGQANYAAAKAGLIGFCKSLAHEVASRGITVNCIAPGFITTPMTDKLNDSQKEAILTRIPSAKLGKVDDIASAALFLASQEANYVTGQTLHVNGGMLMP